MGKRIGLVVFSIALLASPMVASAASSWATGATYSDQVVGKLKYGLTNALLGWTSLVTVPVNASKSGDNVLVGIGQGVVNAVGQTLGGVIDVVTFPIPQIDIPLPAGGTNILHRK